MNQKTGEEETGHKACMKSKNREEKSRPAMRLKAQNRRKTGDELGDGQKACKNYGNREENADMNATSKSTVRMELTSREQASSDFRDKNKPSREGSWRW